MSFAMIAREFCLDKASYTIYISFSGNSFAIILYKGANNKRPTYHILLALLINSGLGSNCLILITKYWFLAFLLLLLSLFRASSTVSFNLIAHKCSACGSYNTRHMGIITGGGAVLDDGAGPNAGAGAGVGALPTGGVVDDDGVLDDGGIGAAGVAGAPQEGGGAGAMAAAAAAANAVLLQAMQLHELHALMEGEDEEGDEEEEWEDAHEDED